ncbi:helix-turn-helix domain-containing protein [Litoribacter ruber]|uniref:helix-turn-helix domain-containing protein n=1 Tax=Litoribacter ruber TaxID=702568 RepID=UPI001BD99C1A|nr:helix-turn-helix domain-containing protein [Litoribacter ruber]MBT0811056.1 helix-turn-helix domain-containing protein [Litoribacter ruber]
MNDVLFTPLRLNELELLIQKSVAKALRSQSVGELGADDDRPLSISETSDFLHIQKQTLYGYVHKGIIPYSKRAGKLYFCKKDLIEWIKEGNKRPFDVEEEAKKLIESRKKKGGAK